MGQENDPEFQFEKLETQIGQMMLDFRNLLGELETLPPTEYETAKREFDKILKKYNLQHTAANKN